MQSNQYDVIVIGGGPAGASAAMHTAAAGYKTLIIDKSVSSGSTGSHARISIFPGFPDGISGADLIKRLHKQAEMSGAVIRSGEVTDVFSSSSVKKVKTLDGADFEARALILATGAAERTYSLQGEKELAGHGVCYSSTIDAPTYRHQAVVVFGKTLEAVEEALNIARYAEKVYFIIPSNKLDVPEPLHERLQKTPRIEPIFSASLKKINGSTEVTSVTILSAGQEKDLQVRGVFLYTHKNRPISGYLKDEIKMSETGCVLVNDEMATSAPGVFACGDILCGALQHPAIASAQGTIAGMSADKFLRQV